MPVCAPVLRGSRYFPFPLSETMRGKTQSHLSSATHNLAKTNPRSKGKCMNRFWKSLAAAAVTFSVLTVFSQSALAQVKVMTSGGFAAPLREMLPEFEKATGVSVEVILGKSQGSGPDTISAQLGRGVAADIVIMSREGLNDLISANRIVAHSDID